MNSSYSSKTYKFVVNALIHCAIIDVSYQFKERKNLKNYSWFINYFKSTTYNYYMSKQSTYLHEHRNHSYISPVFLMWWHKVRLLQPVNIVQFGLFLIFRKNPDFCKWWTGYQNKNWWILNKHKYAQKEVKHCN